MSFKHDRKRYVSIFLVTIFCVLFAAAFSLFLAYFTIGHVHTIKPVVEAESIANAVAEDVLAESGVTDSIQDATSLNSMKQDLNISDADTEAVKTKPDIDSQIESIINAMSLEDKVAQMFFITPEALSGTDVVTTANEQIAAAINETPVGGLVLFSYNIQSEPQLEEMINGIQDYSYARTGIPMFIAVDEEGGTVTRISTKGAIKNVPDIPDMFSIGDTKEPLNAYGVGLEIGKYLNRLGINTDFAPVCDVFTNPENTVIGRRSFGNDAQLVADMVAAEIHGLHDFEVYATVKHFPGHGNTSGDSHTNYVFSHKSLEELQDCELIPFKVGIEAGADFVMVGHISLPEIIGDNTPASLSRIMINDLLKSDMGFDGVVITDALDMGAITSMYPPEEAAVKAVNAGVDMLLMASNFTNTYNAVFNAVKNGNIEESRINDSVKRILNLKQNRLNIKALFETYN